MLIFLYLTVETIVDSRKDERKEKKIPLKSPREVQGERRLAKLEEDQAKKGEEMAKSFSKVHKSLQEISKSLAESSGLEVRSGAQGPKEELHGAVRAGWQPGTESSYKLCWRRWCRYAQNHGVEELAPSLNQVIKYLTCLFNKGLEYNSINLHQSTMSGMLPPIQGFNVGEHPLVSRLLKGVFNCRPPKVKLFPLLEVDKVLGHIKS